MPQDVQRWSVESMDPGVKCMTADDVYRRRLEGKRMHYGSAMFHALPPVEQLIAQQIADAIGIPLRYLTGEDLPPVSAVDMAAMRAWVIPTQPAEPDEALRNRVRVCWHMDVFSRVSRREMEAATGQALEDIAQLYDLVRG